MVIRRKLRVLVAAGALALAALLVGAEAAAAGQADDAWGLEARAGQLRPADDLPARLWNLLLPPGVEPAPIAQGNNLTDLPQTDTAEPAKAEPPPVVVLVAAALAGLSITAFRLWRR